MPNYRLSQKAKQDLIRIAQYSDENFGAEKSNQYREQFKNRFETLSNTPLLYPSVDYIRIGYRRAVCGVHSIYYKITDDTVEIIRILGRQNTNQLL